MRRIVIVSVLLLTGSLCVAPLASARPTSGVPMTARQVQHKVQPKAQHKAQHTVTYHVETRGQIHADMAVFRKQAQATYDDPRGWRRAGVRFVRVASGGTFTLVLSEASKVPSFSSECSAQWSCRVGRYVIINQTRWLHASQVWHQHHRSVRSYRHMVVNHETGHWLGWNHRGCPQAGNLAPVMMPQSKGLNGCRPNAWPTQAELRVPRFN